MRPRDVRLAPDVAGRLMRRVAELRPLASIAADRDAATEQERQALAELAERLANNYPFHDPRYAGQMLAPPHPVAWAAYATAMLLNPNNHALDGGPATAAMEREAVAAIAGMVGHDVHLGHLTSSGTIANLEALWVARELQPARTVVLASNAHYTHARICALLGVGHDVVGEDERGRMDLERLDARLARGDVGCVVATLGTTALGALDELDAVADLCRDHDARLHVDAAYGGFFALVLDGAPFGALARADSVVVDPHKHGLQPYGCGCVVFADPQVSRLYAHESPYTYFTSPDLHLGEISLECSRAGAAAAALWTTLRALPLTADGLGAHLAAARAAAVRVAAALRAAAGVALVVEPQLDIVCCFARKRRASEVSAASERAFDALAGDGWHVAKLRVGSAWLRRTHPSLEADDTTATVLRCCLMKPAHAGVAEQLAAALGGALTAA